MPSTARGLQSEQRAPVANRARQGVPQTKSAHRSTNKFHGMPKMARGLQSEQRAPTQRATANKHKPIPLTKARAVLRTACTETTEKYRSEKLPVWVVNKCRRALYAKILSVGG